MVELLDYQKDFIKKELKPYLENDDLKGAWSRGYDIARGSVDIDTWGLFFLSDLYDIFRWLFELGLPVLESMVDIPYQFFARSDISSINIPSNIESIDEDAFTQCSHLKEVTFNEGLELISFDAFGGCVSINEIVFPASLKDVAPGAFQGCTGLRTVKVLGKTNVNFKAFSRCGNVDVYLPKKFSSSFKVFIEAVENDWDEESYINIIMY